MMVLEMLIEPKLASSLRDPATRAQRPRERIYESSIASDRIAR